MNEFKNNEFITDAKMFSDIFRNLLTNACKYARVVDKPYVRIEAGFKKGKIYVEIEDNGVGIPWGEESQIFDLFFRSKLSKKYNIDGYGIGLFICREYCRRLGGDLSVRNVSDNTSSERVSGVKARFSLYSMK